VFLAFRTFRNLDETQKQEYIAQKRKEIANKLSPYKWLDSENASCAVVQISERLRQVFYSVARYLFHELTDDDDEDIMESIRKHVRDQKNLYVLFNLIQPSDMDYNILSDWDTIVSKDDITMDGETFLFHIKNEWRNIFFKYIDESVMRVERIVKKQIDITKRSKILYKLAEESFVIFDIALDAAYHEFKNSISEPDKWVNIFTFSFFRENIHKEIEILIVNAENNDIYRGPRYNTCASKFIVLLYFADLHFESLGHTQGNKISRIFDKDHPFIQEFFDQ